jgi:hypothetical protein
MKVNTNLSNKQLKQIGIGLQKLSESGQGEIELENKAEKSLVAEVVDLAKLSNKILLESISTILKD